MVSKNSPNPHYVSIPADWRLPKIPLTCTLSRQEPFTSTQQDSFPAKFPDSNSLIHQLDNPTSR
jgi:hypothetical protein